MVFYFAKSGQIKEIEARIGEDDDSWALTRPLRRRPGAEGHRRRRQPRQRGQVHGWASYFYAIALNAGNSSILLGPTAYNQLPVKLMQLFLDVPYASELTQVNTARKKDTQEGNRVQRRARKNA
ncbi:hypothetical protein ABZZ47_39910 [Streptomyces sp. NPDC006465]|uniref:hypothetical protein n=1 Tax=Streptomyces sp. NPDC006465 TaxID=3157174 RepID=UPI0033AE8C03